MTETVVSKAILAFRTPDPSLVNVPNTIRQALADIIESQAYQLDKYGIALMAISEGAETPQQIAAKILDKFREPPRRYG